MKKIICALFALFLCACLFCQNENEREVVLQVTNVKTSEGTILVSVHDSEQNFKTHVPVAVMSVPAKTPAVSMSLSLAPGEYAFCVFHDVNETESWIRACLEFPKSPSAFQITTESRRPENSSATRW